MNRHSMIIYTISITLIIIAALLMIVGTVPMENKLENNTLTVKYILGKDTIDMTHAKFLPLPEGMNNLIRVGGTSIGKKRSGNFKNMKTGTKYKLFITGKGEKVYFEIGDKKYIVDDISKAD